MHTDNLQNDYSEMVTNLSKPGEDILATLTPEKCHLIHMILGASGETGELLDNIKKHLIYNKSIDLDYVIKELGDIEFFLEGIRQYFDISRQEVLQHNMDKLLLGENARYKSGNYSDQQAKQRADVL